MLAAMAGVSVGYEGYDDGKMYFGVYTRDTEYGWVVTDKDIYLDTVLKKDLTSK
jgi:hypothetical protein